MGYLGYKPADKPLTAADITDGIITTTKIADSNITSAKITDATIVNGDIANATIALAKLSATGTPSASTFLRGDNAWGEAGAAAGQVIQVVTATDSTARTTTSTSFVTGSNTLSVSITPSSASNKIFIIVSATARVGENTYFTVYRGATDLGATSSKGLIAPLGDAGVVATASGLGMSILDSPNTTSSTTYQVYFRISGSSNTATLNYENSKSSITLMEIKG
jgi:hypothetical protein